MAPATYYRFMAGSLVLLALNAFSTPDPGSFEVSDEQLDWLEKQLTSLPESARVMLLLHCYPTDLKQGGERLQRLVRGPRILLVNMGHARSNEISNDGATLYTATRSAGQIEEGPVGFSVTSVDDDVVSWKFLPLTESSLVMITSPADERLLTSSPSKPREEGAFTVRAKFWGDHKAASLSARLDGRNLPMQRVSDSQVWQVRFGSKVAGRSHEPVVTAQTGSGAKPEDRIHLRVGTPAIQHRVERDQDSALGAWPERDILGTQLGPNKNGKKW